MENRDRKGRKWDPNGGSDGGGFDVIDKHEETMMMLKKMMMMMMKVAKTELLELTFVMMEWRW